MVWSSTVDPWSFDCPSHRAGHRLSGGADGLGDLHPSELFGVSDNGMAMEGALGRSPELGLKPFTMLSSYVTFFPNCVESLCYLSWGPYYLCIQPLVKAAFALPNDGGYSVSPRWAEPPAVVPHLPGEGC